MPMTKAQAIAELEHIYEILPLIAEAVKEEKKPINQYGNWKRYPIAKQVARIGNSVVPIMAEKLVEANCPYLKVGERVPNLIIDDTQEQLRFA